MIIYYSNLKNYNYFLTFMVKAAFQRSKLSKSRKTWKKYRRLPIPRELNSSTNLTVSGKAFPVSIMTDLKWGHCQMFNVSTLAASNFKIRANSVYDPNVLTGSG